MISNNLSNCHLIKQKIYKALMQIINIVSPLNFEIVFLQILFLEILTYCDKTLALILLQRLDFLRDKTFLLCCQFYKFCFSNFRRKCSNILFISLYFILFYLADFFTQYKSGRQHCGKIYIFEVYQKQSKAKFATFEGSSCVPMLI